MLMKRIAALQEGELVLKEQLHASQQLIGKLKVYAYAYTREAIPYCRRPLLIILPCSHSAIALSNYWRETFHDSVSAVLVRNRNTIILTLTAGAAPMAPALLGERTFPCQTSNNRYPVSWSNSFFFTAALLTWQHLCSC